MNDSPYISIGDLVAEEGLKKKRRRKREPKAQIKPKRIIPRHPVVDIEWELNEGENLDEVEAAIGVLSGFPFTEEVETYFANSCFCGRTVLGTNKHICWSCAKPIDLRTTTEENAVKIVRATAKQQKEWEKLEKEEKIASRGKKSAFLAYDEP